jgi:hypothetical protein
LLAIDGEARILLSFCGWSAKAKIICLLGVNQIITEALSYDSSVIFFNFTKDAHNAAYLTSGN